MARETGINLGIQASSVQVQAPSLPPIVDEALREQLSDDAPQVLQLAADAMWTSSPGCAVEVSADLPVDASKADDSTSWQEMTADIKVVISTPSQAQLNGTTTESICGGSAAGVVAIVGAQGTAIKSLVGARPVLISMYRVGNASDALVGAWSATSGSNQMDAGVNTSTTAAAFDIEAIPADVSRAWAAELAGEEPLAGQTQLDDPTGLI